MESSVSEKTSMTKPRTDARTRSFQFPGLQLTIEHEAACANGIQILTFEGAIDNHNVYKLNKQIHSMLPAWQENVILNMKKLEHINAMGISILFSIFHHQKENQKQALIGGVHPFLEEVFHLVYLPQEVPILQNVEEAKKNLQLHASTTD